MDDSPHPDIASRPTPHEGSRELLINDIRADVERMLAITKAQGVDESFRSRQKVLELLRQRIVRLSDSPDLNSRSIENEFLQQVQSDLTFRRLFTASSAVESLAILCSQMNTLDDASRLRGLSDDQLAAYSDFVGLMLPLVSDVAVYFTPGYAQRQRAEN
jgi:hypothetical protein